MKTNIIEFPNRIWENPELKKLDNETTETMWTVEADTEEILTWKVVFNKQEKELERIFNQELTKKWARQLIEQFTNWSLAA